MRTSLALGPLLLALPAFADIAVPGAAPRPAAEEAEEIRCGSNEWLAIRRAVAAWCDPLTDEEGCAEVRRGLRTCEGELVLARTERHRYAATVRTDTGAFYVEVERRSPRWQVLALEREVPCA